MDLALQLCCLLRHLLLGPVPLPECSFSWQTSRSSGISNMFGSLAQTQVSHNGLSGLQRRASLDTHCQISAALWSCRGGIQDPYLVVCDLCLPPASKASIGWMMFILPTLVTCLRRDSGPPELHLQQPLLFLCQSRKSPGLFLSQIRNLAGLGIQKASFPLFQCNQAPFNLLTSFSISLSCNSKFPGALFLYKLYILCFSLPALFALVDLPKSDC